MKSQQPKRKAKQNKCVVLVPVFDNIEPGCEDALRALEQKGYTVWRSYGLSDITVGRSHMATNALKSGFDELMWIDSDILFDPDDVDKLRRHNQPLVGGIYAKKGNRDMACVFPPGTHEIIFGDCGGLLKVKYVGTGFFLTRREVYSSLVRQRRRLGWVLRRMSPFVPFFLHTVGEHNVYLSEDYSFCANAAKCGYKIMVDTSIRLGHIGRYVYSWEEIGGKRERMSIVKVKVIDEDGIALSKIRLPRNIIGRGDIGKQQPTSRPKANQQELTSA